MLAKVRAYHEFGVQELKSKIDGYRQNEQELRAAIATEKRRYDELHVEYKALSEKHDKAELRNQRLSDECASLHELENQVQMYLAQVEEAKEQITRAQHSIEERIKTVTGDAQAQIQIAEKDLRAAKADLRLKIKLADEKTASHESERERKRLRRGNDSAPSRPEIRQESISTQHSALSSDQGESLDRRNSSRTPIISPPESHSNALAPNSQLVAPVTSGEIRNQAPTQSAMSSSVMIRLHDMLPDVRFPHALSDDASRVLRHQVAELLEGVTTLNLGNSNGCVTHVVKGQRGPFWTLIGRRRFSCRQCANGRLLCMINNANGELEALPLPPEMSSEHRPSDLAHWIYCGGKKVISRSKKLWE